MNNVCHIGNNPPDTEKITKAKTTLTFTEAKDYDTITIELNDVNDIKQIEYLEKHTDNTQLILIVDESDQFEDINLESYIPIELRSNIQCEESDIDIFQYLLKKPIYQD